MERLSTCYFCGAGPQETLRDRPVVPEAVLADRSAQRTIALCPDCRSKFDRLHEMIAEAADEGHQRRLDAPAADSVSLLDDDPLEAIESTLSLSDSTTSVTPGTARDSGAAEDSGASIDPSSTDSPDGEATTDAPSAPADEESASTSTAPPESTTDDASDGPTDDRSSSPAASGADAGGSTGERDGSDSTAAGERTDEATPDGGDSAADEDPTAGKPYDRTQYSRVVKLLQNREFPVELDAVYELARGAYDIDEETTTEIIGALIDRGVIEERGGTLFRD